MKAAMMIASYKLLHHEKLGLIGEPHRFGMGSWSDSVSRCGRSDWNTLTGPLAQARIRLLSPPGLRAILLKEVKTDPAQRTPQYPS